MIDLRKTCSVLAVGAFLALCLSASAQNPNAPTTTCSNASLKGLYGLLITGYDGSGQYRMGVGQIKSNGAGSFTGIETVSDDGVIYDNLATTGTYSISSNCTGNGTIINVKNGNQSHYNLVMDPLGKQLEAAGTDSGHGTASGRGLALGTATCSTKTAAGTYGFHGGGYLAAQGVLAFDGQYVLDGTGKLSGIETRSVDGTIISAASIAGTYSLAPTCRGTISYKLNGTAVKLNIVMVSAGQSFFAIDTDTGTVSTSVAQQ
jgi:hypothetical protein